VVVDERGVNRRELLQRLGRHSGISLRRAARELHAPRGKASSHVNLDARTPSFLALALGFGVDVDDLQPDSSDDFRAVSYDHAGAAARLRGVSV